MLDPASLAVGIVAGCALAGIGAFVADHVTRKGGDLDSDPVAAPGLGYYCRGWRDEPSVRPCVECQGCARWMRDGEPRLTPPPDLRVDAAGRVWCPDRIAG